jgi:hypothetical protein
MERLGRESILHWFGSVLPLLTTWQLHNKNKLPVTDHIVVNANFNYKTMTKTFNWKYKYPTTVKLCALQISHTTLNQGS